ncbi:hypothetical protein Q4I32_007429 [Leishmania shawi]|uniref:Uncharacterized protein n=1 Tax=Leishmania shawi TaxID=5680 RepID=A0AAW3BBS4_9TRYP
MSSALAAKLHFVSLILSCLASILLFLPFLLPLPAAGVPRRRETPQRGIAGPSTPALGGEGPSSLPAPASTEPLLVLAGSSTDDAGKPERCIAADVGGQAPGGAASAKPAAVSMLVPSM